MTKFTILNVTSFTWTSIPIPIKFCLTSITNIFRVTLLTIHKARFAESAIQIIITSTIITFLLIWTKSTINSTSFTYTTIPIKSIRTSKTIWWVFTLKTMCYSAAFTQTTIPMKSILTIITILWALTSNAVQSTGGTTNVLQIKASCTFCTLFSSL